MNLFLALLILFLISLIIDSIGFKKYVWFLSIGYGLSIFGCGIAIIIIYSINGNLNISGLIASTLLIIYGFRLGGFLLLREIKSISYNKTIQKEIKSDKSIPFFVKVSIWIFAALLYTIQASCILLVLDSRGNLGFFDTNVIEIIGLIIMALGIVIETLADNQKSKSKKIDPKKPAMNGLYKLCRCPNYYGEILMWTGTYIFSFSVILISTPSWWMFLITTIAYISIVYVMLNGAKRLEKRQNKNYENLLEYQEYKNKTPLIYFLFIPIKSLENSKIIK